MDGVAARQLIAALAVTPSLGLARVAKLHPSRLLRHQSQLHRFPLHQSVHRRLLLRLLVKRSPLMLRVVSFSTTDACFLFTDDIQVAPMDTPV